jgi:hypothetical protein
MTLGFGDVDQIGIFFLKTYVLGYIFFQFKWYSSLITVPLRESSRGMGFIYFMADVAI